MMKGGRREDPGRMPNFLVIGAMKAGTTSLYRYLREHPDVFMPSIKELEFFAGEGTWSRGIAWYQKQFQGAGAAAAVGEASTAYSKYPIVRDVPERIAACIPDCRLIYLVRDPIERIRSHYEHRVAIGTERSPFAQAIFSDPVYLTCSRYADQIERYRKHVPPERLLLVRSEDLLTSRHETVRGIFRYLGVDPDVVPSTIDQEFYRTQARASYPPLLARVRHSLKGWVPASKRAKELVDLTIPSMLRGGRARPSASSTARKVTIDPDVRAQLVASLADDVQRLSASMPPGFDGWGILGDPPPSFDVGDLRTSGRAAGRGGP